MFKKSTPKISTEDYEEIVKLEKELQNIINGVKTEEPKKETPKFNIDQLNLDLEKDLKEYEYKHYYRKFKKGLKNSNIEVKKSVKKHFKDNVDKLINKTLPIKSLIKQVQEEYNDKKSILHAYLYIEARKKKNEYTKDYNWIDGSKIQWNSTHTKKYTNCLEVNIQLDNKLVKDYIRGKFYNDEDDGQEFIQKFVKLIKDNNEDAKETIDLIQASEIILGFKIISVIKLKNKYKKPNHIKAELKDDANHKAINTKYTNYMINLMSSDIKDLIKLDYNEYIQNNYRPNSCVLTAIINKYYDRFNYIKSDGRRAYKELTYDYLCELLDLESKPSDIGCTVERAIEYFFKVYDFTGIYVYDSYLNLIHKHISNPKNKNLSTMRVMIKDSHLYELNDKIESLKHTTQKVDEKQELIIGNKYNIMNFNNELTEYFVETEKDIIKLLKDEVPKKEIKDMKILCQCNLKHLLFQLVEGGYTPKVNFDTALYSLSLYLNNKVIQIIQANNNPIYGQLIDYQNLKEYQDYTTAYETFYNSVVKKEYLSDYHPSVIEIDNYYKINNVCGYFGDYSQKRFDGLDENKAYTNCLMNIKQIPIFNYFDVYRKYNNEPIEDLSQYIIDVNSISSRTAIIFPTKYSKTYGYVLKHVDIPYKILYVRKPLQIEDVNFENPVNELFNNKNITMKMKKAISNITTGLLEKKQNKGELSKIFKNYDEAKFYCDEYNGHLLALSNIDDYETEDNEKVLYVVKISEKKQLINGFLPIKEMIYLNQRLKLLAIYDKLKKLGIIVRGIKTDCVFYNQTRNSKSIIESNFSMGDKIGNFKYEDKKYLPDSPIQVCFNDLLKIPEFTVNTKEFTNEYDTKIINAFIKEHKNLLIKGLFPGVGKSTLAKNYDNTALFNCPYNTLCQQLKIDEYNAITYSKMFGLVGSDEEMKNIKQYDINNYKTIVFDEIFLYEPRRLKRIAELMKQYPDKNYIATGDCDQRAPVGFQNSEYLTTCMNILFPDQIILKQMKRFDNEEDKQKIISLKKDILNPSVSIQSICDKYNIKTITKLSQLKTKLNICLFNFRCETVNNYVHETLMGKTKKFEVGQEIICKEYEKKNRLITNYKYKIIKMKKQDVVIRDEVELLDYKITPQILLKHFKLPYAVTCDSVQGITKDEKMTIFDSNTPYVDRKFLWTAMTRVKRLEDITIFIHSKEEVERLTESRLSLYFKQKVESYKSQDRKTQREFNNDDYVNVDWIHEQYQKNKYCLFCKKHYELYLDENSSVVSNITVDRINNKLAHVKNNCQLCCHHCNITKGNRY